MRRSGRGVPPADLPIHRWAHRHEVEDGEQPDTGNWPRELLERREEQLRERTDSLDADLTLELRRFLRES
jgi:hypothetical protein